MANAEIGVIGGSGLYRLFDAGQAITVETPYGPTSDSLSVGKLAGKNCAFLPRHGRNHHLPPHRVPYKANLFAFKELGVKAVIAQNAVGSLNELYKVGDFVVADQLMDWTMGKREDTYFDGPITTHIGLAKPYCPVVREALLKAALHHDLTCHDGGSIVAVNGPRFPTLAESRFFSAQGWDLENMTQYPEAALARELGISYANISLVTNSHLKASENSNGDFAQALDIVAYLRNRSADIRSLVVSAIQLLPHGDFRPEQIKEAMSRGRWS